MTSQATTGLVLHRAIYYDFLLWLLSLGRERNMREKVLQLARLQPGEMVLDVGCGTGTLAITAKQHLGSQGSIFGIDASPEMIARARKKAKKAGVDVSFNNGLAEALPFEAAQFDAVLSTVMLHHLPRSAREQCSREIKRVLKPGGRVLVVDFPEPGSKGLLRHFHPRHGYVSAQDMTAVLDSAGLMPVESGSVGIHNLQFVLAAAPCCA